MEQANSKTAEELQKLIRIWRKPSRVFKRRAIPAWRGGLLPAAAQRWQVKRIQRIS